jgi:hypothetical protein
MCIGQKYCSHNKDVLLRINKQINNIYNDTKLHNTKYDNRELRRYMMNNYTFALLSDFMIYESMLNNIPRLQFSKQENDKFNEFMEKVSNNIGEYKKIYGQNICIGVNVIIAYLFPNKQNMEFFLLKAKYNKHQFEKLDKLSEIDRNQYRYYTIDKIKTY